jgi:hypothetical protein
MTFQEWANAAAGDEPRSDLKLEHLIHDKSENSSSGNGAHPLERL